MPNLNIKPQHPASYVKKIIKENKLTTVKAAELLGIGRIALTNFLNEKAELSHEMAARLEKVFDISKSYLLQMQLERYSYEVHRLKKELKLDSYEEPIQYYASDPPLEITALKINNWSDNRDARNLLPVLIRRLINSTGKELTKVDFPGHENSQLPGWDGEVIAGSATQRIPSGKSGWELGTGSDPQKKANNDYKSRTEGTLPEEKQNLTFVFVTSRKWAGKKAWIKDKQAQEEWVDVIAYDADDLEQWLELSLETRIWFLEKMDIYNEGLCTLEQCWEDWASATNPKLNKTLFKEVVEMHKEAFLSWLKNNPPAKPFIVTSDSHEEALAFLACMFDHVDKIFSDKTIAVKSLDALKKLKITSFKGIIIISSSDAEKNLGDYRNSVPTIIIRHKNQLINKEEACITLNMPSRNSFKNSLTEMGIDDDQSDHYIKNSCYSPTILRRLLSATEEGKYPQWSKDNDIINKLIPITLIGFWDNNVPADKEVIKKLFDVERDQIIEQSITELYNKDTTLLWRIDNKVGIKSKIENLSIINTHITESHLNNFLGIAQEVLGEEDPALELPKEDRFMAAYYGKIPKHSKYLREGICETLVLLSMHGNKWFQSQFGINIQDKINGIIRSLLKPLKPNTWLSHQGYLTKYAEAAPEEFIKIVEEDLNGTSSTILSLHDSGTGEIFDRHPRINILWALEILAWNSQYLLKVVLILAKLSQYKINDGYANTPLNSLKGIFKSWLPQTSANLDERKKILSALIKDFPSVGWEICMDQIDVMNDCGYFSSRPRWRNDYSGLGGRVSAQENNEFIREAMNKALGWNNHDENSLGELLKRLQAFNNEDKTRIWKLIIDWNLTDPSDEQKSKLRERIRYHVLSKHEEEANNIYNLLEPKDLIWKHYWLFASAYVQPSQGDKQIEQFRIKALSEIWEKRNYLGLIELVSKSGACRYIGFSIRNIITQSDILPLFDRLLSGPFEEMKEKTDQFIIGFLSQGKESAEAKVIGDLIDHYIKSGEENKIIRILKNAPFHDNTWNIVSNLNKELQQRYWSEINVTDYNFKKAELKEMLERLIWVNRPEFAISMIHFPQVCKNVDSEQLVILLKKMAANSYELRQQYQIQPYVIEEIFKELSGRPDIPKANIASLELLYIETLEHTSYGIPHLEKNITESPQLFIQALALVYKREDGQDDSKKWRGKNLENNKSIASMMLTLLNKVALLPGTVNGAIDKNNLLNWVEEARRLCIENNREKIGDQYIGGFLSKAPIGVDGVWPCESVREVLEYIKSEQLARGLSTSVYNSRGWVMRGNGGEQEKELVVKYKEYAQFLKYDYPYVSKILNDIAKLWESTVKHYNNEEVLRKYIAT